MKLNVYGNMPVTLSRDPVNPMEAATKNYVDYHNGLHASNVGLHLTAEQNTFLDAVSATATEVNYLTGVTSGIQAQLGTKLNLAGGVMTGFLTLSANPINALEAATKNYTDTQDALKVSKAGDTMTGALVLHADPAVALGAATKQYVDSNLLSHTSDAALHMTGEQNTFLDAVNATSTEVNYLVGVTSALQTQIDSKVAKSGSTMTGALVLNADPVSALGAATKQFVEASVTAANSSSTSGLALKVDKAGDTMTGALLLNADPVNALGAATKQFVESKVSTHESNDALHMTSGQNAFLDAVTVSATELNLLTGVTSAVQTQINSKVAKAGDTMTGALVLNADPVLALGAATKQFVDTSVSTLASTVTAQDALKVAKAGDTMTGALILNADPVNALGAATKQFVESNVSVHATDAALHLTAGQNTFLDAVTATSTEVNQLVGVTSAVQTQIDSKVAKAGDTMTGALVLNADPVSALGAATKQFVEAQDAFKVAKAGDTMTGALVLNADPVLALGAATKGYVDTNLSTHATDAALHLTAGQNTFLDAVTVSATEVNYLGGVSSGVQAQLDTKFAKAGGTVTGDITLATGKTIFVDKAPATPTEVVNKAYVDSIANGLDWKDPVTDVNLVSDTLATPPVSPVNYDVYIVGAAPTGAWVGKAGHATFFNGTSWVFLQARPVAAGDRFGVGIYTDTVVDASLTAYNDKIVTVVSATPGAVTYSEAVLTPGSTTLVFDQDSHNFGISFTYTDELVWVPTNTSVNLVPGAGVSLDGSTLNAKLGKGLEIDGSSVNAPIAVNLNADAGLFFTLDGTTASASDAAELSVQLKDATLVKDATGVAVAPAVIADIADRVSKTIDSTVSANVTFAATKKLKVTDAPVAGTDVANKQYVDAADVVLQGQVTTLQGTVSTLNTDPTTKVYVDAQDALKVAKAGDTMTGALVLNADPVTALGAATKQFVESNVATHATDAALHMTSGQNAFLDAVTASAGEVNYLVGVTSAVQTQINSKVAKAGDTMTGALVLNADPVLALGAATKQFVDTSVSTLASTVTAQDALKVAKAGDTMTGALVLHADPVVALGAATKQFVESKVSTHESNDALHLTAGQNTFLDTVTVTATEVNYLAGVTAAVQTQIDSKVAKAGDTMTGALVLNADPVLALGAATKQFVESSVSAANSSSTSGLALKVDKAGDTMTGFLTLSADPTSIMHAVTKQYSDTNLSTHASDASLHTTPAQNTFLDGISISSIEANYLAGTTSAVQTQLDSKVALAGSTMTGPLVLSADPVANLEAATKVYVDSKDALKVAKAGDTMTGALILNADPVALLGAVTKQYSDTNLSNHVNDAAVHMTVAQNTFLDAVTVTSEEVNYLAGTTSEVQVQLDSKLNLTGGTMTGAITLSADPVAALQPATKQFTEAQDALKVAKAGDTMTGALILNADPVVALGAATKQFVESSVSAANSSSTSGLALKVDKAGDTMTGFLTLSAAPTAALHASTKSYVDDSVVSVTTYLDGKDTALQGQITTLQDTVAILNTDPTTKNYVDVQDSLKVSKAGDTMTGYLVLHADPLQAMHPTTKQYVDAVAQGLVTKPQVRLASTVNYVGTYQNGTLGVNSTLTAISNGSLSVDGMLANSGDRVLLKDQTNKAENGDYVVQQVGNAGTPYILKRVSTIDESSEVPGSYFYVFDGSTLKGTGWVMGVDVPMTFAIGVDPIYINQFSGQGNIIAGDGLTLTGNTIAVNSVASSRIVVNSDAIDLATTGVVANNYTKVAVDSYGRVTAGSNPTTLAGYGIADGQLLNANLTSLSGVSTFGIVVRDNANNISTKEIITSGVGITVANGSGAATGNITVTSNATSANTASAIVARDTSGNFSANVITAALAGNADTATVLATARNFSASGDVTAPAVSFNGGAGVELVTTLTDTGVVAGAYTRVTVDAKGRVSLGANPSTVADMGLIDAATITYVNEQIDALRKEVADLYLYVMSRV